jgi:hypothetical protein
MIKIFFIEKGERFNELLGLIHTYVYGLIMICAINGYTYFITFTNDHSRYDYMYLVKHKS